MGLHDSTHSYEDQRMSTTTGFLLHKHDLVVCAVGLRKGDNSRPSQPFTVIVKNSRQSLLHGFPTGQLRGGNTTECGSLVHRALTMSKTKWTSSKMTIGVQLFCCIAGYISRVDYRPARIENGGLVMYSL
jgi:hypothetical protein